MGLNPKSPPFFQLTLLGVMLLIAMMTLSDSSTPSFYRIVGRHPLTSRSPAGSLVGDKPARGENGGVRGGDDPGYARGENGGVRGGDDPGHARKENGGVRGGGDAIAGEVFTLERVVLEKIRVWKDQNRFHIRDSDFAKLEAMIPTDNIKAPPHWVVSIPHACLDGKTKPKGDCVDPKQERDIVKRMGGSSPVLLVGRVRWNTMPTRQKEYDVLHELFGITFWQKGKPFVDESFEKSYLAIIESQKDWEDAVVAHREFLTQIRTADTLLESLVKLDMIQATVDSYKTFSPLYKSCVESEKKAWANLPNSVQTCVDARNELFAYIEKSIMPGIEAQFEKSLQEGISTDHQAWTRTLKNAKWQRFFDEGMDAYMNARKTILTQKTYSSVTSVSTTLDRYCGSIDKDHDLRIVMNCNFGKGPGAVLEYFNYILCQMKEDLLSKYELELVEESKQANPL